MENAAFIFLNRTTSSQLKCDLLVDLNNAYHPPSTVAGGEDGTVDGGRWEGRYRRRLPVGRTPDGGRWEGRWEGLWPVEIF